MSLPRRDIVPVDPARNVAEEDPPSRPGAQYQPPQASMDGSQLVQWLSAQAGNMAGDLQHNVRALMVRASSPMPVSDGRDEVSSLRQQLRHQQQQAHKELQTMLRNQALAIETFQSKWQMAGQEAHAFIARTRAQSEDFVRAELTAAQRFEDSLQRQYDGQLRSHVHALQDECREHVGQEEDKMRKELQHALTQESSVCHDQLQQALRHQVCQEEYADAAAHQEMEQLKQLISQQAEAMKRFESQSQQYVTQQQDEWTQKQHTQFPEVDGVIRDKDEVIRDAERRAQQSTPVFAGTSTQPYATPVEKKTLTAIAAVPLAEPVPAFHSPGLSLGASVGNMNLKSKNKGSSTMVVPARILVLVSDVNPMAIADSGASHVILPQSALFDSKSAKPVNLRLAAGEIQAVEAHREIFAEHVTIPLCPLGRVIWKLQLTARRYGHLRL